MTTLMPGPFIAIAVTAGGPPIGRRLGQRLAGRELAEMSFWERIWNWLVHLPRNAGNLVPGGWFGLIALAVIAVLVVTVVVYWVRPSGTRRARPDSALASDSLSARDYRRSARELAAAGDYAGAIVAGVRAIAAELDERSILPSQPGRTADELAAEAGGELPALAADLRTVTRLFDDVRYGDREGSLAGYQLVSRVDEAVRAARPQGAPVADATPAGFGVPR